jgi:formylglycine-generating enzyme required for sulfatase activity
MDWKWSKAVGLKEWKHGTPEHKSRKITGVYPWGKQWPPPSGAGNYGENLGVDDFEFTSPVGSFAANQYGLYDMGGNVWQWCGDWYNSKQQYRVLRGAAWNDFNPVGLLSSYRNISVPGLRDFNIGFRVVLAGAGRAR